MSIPPIVRQEVGGDRVFQPDLYSALIEGCGGGVEQAEGVEIATFKAAKRGLGN